MIQDIDTYCNHGDDILGNGLIEFSRISPSGILVNASDGTWDVTINGAILKGLPAQAFYQSGSPLFLRYGFISGFELPMLNHWTGKQVIYDLPD